MANTFGLNTAAELINGTAGADTIYGGTTTNATGTGNDTINGLAGNDTLFGLDGTDSLFGGTNNDTLYGGNDNDTLSGDANIDVLFGDGGNDSLQGGTENDTLYGGVSGDALFGDAGTDILFGGDSGDTLYGGTGGDLLHGDVASDDPTFSTDRMFGEDGDDRLYGGRADDSLYGGIGNDRLFGGGEIDRLFGDTENDRLSGGAGADSLYGGAGNDYLAGGKDADTLYGGTENDVVLGGGGSDVLRGEAGTDRLFGGLGDDTFSLGDVADADVIGGAGVDRIAFDTGNNTLGSGRYVVDLIDLGQGNDVFQLPNLAGSGTTFALPSNMDGTAGFQIVGGAANDLLGSAVRDAGDVNGDSFGDFVIGSQGSDIDGTDAGSAWVVFGKASGFPASLVTGALDGTNGFRIGGALANALLGSDVAGVGDVNNDGFDDLVVGAKDGTLAGAGNAYVVFGKASGFAATVSVAALAPSSGFTLTTGTANDDLGGAVSGVGDVNGDGIDDFVVSASGITVSAGSAFVVFGSTAGFAATLDPTTLNGTNGFRVDGTAAFQRVGGAVGGAGDVNGDGIADLIVNVAGDDAAYVVYGRTSGFAASLDIAAIDGSNGFRLSGFPGSVTSTTFAQPSARGAGDVNGDGIDDIVVGATEADDTGANAGAAWVLFGRSGGFGAGVDVGFLDGSTGFRLDGFDGGDFAGVSVSGAGDVNGDGFDDVLVGASFANQPGFANVVGGAHLVYGHAGAFAPVLHLGALDATQGINLHGEVLTEATGTSVSAAGDINGDGYADLLVGAPEADLNALSNNGRTFVLFGGPQFGLPTQGVGYTVDGNAGNDTLQGRDGDDRLTGGANDDIVVGSADNDSVDGGTGSDFLDYDAIENGILADLLAGTVDKGAAGFDRVSGFEIINASSGDDRIVGDNLANTLQGNIGDDVLQGAGGNDALLGGDDDDQLFGGGGNDGLDGGFGADLLQGGSGNDGLVGGLGRDSMFGGSGNDGLFGGDGGDVLEGGDANDELMGGLGDDVLRGDDGIDGVFYDDATAQVIVNLSVNQAVGANGVDFIQSVENVTGGAFNDILTGDGGANRIDGADGNDFLDAGGGNDSLLGGFGFDMMFGGDGDDLLDDAITGPGLAANQLFGGNGNDTVSYATQSGIVNASLTG